MLLQATLYPHLYAITHISIFDQDNMITGHKDFKCLSSGSDQLIVSKIFDIIVINIISCNERKSKQSLRLFSHVILC